MQEKNFSPDGNRGVQLWQQHAFQLGNTWSTEVYTASSPTEKENQPLKPICLTPILPRTHSRLHGPTFTSPDSLPGQPLQTSTPVQSERTSRIPAQPSKLLMNSELSAFRPCQHPEKNGASQANLKGRVPLPSTKSAGTSGSKPLSPVSYRSSPGSSPPFFSRKDDSPEPGYSSSNNRERVSLEWGKSSSISREKSSPESGYDSRASPEQEIQPVKKKGRATYRPDQLKILERQFQENPYPDAERLETLSRDIRIPESKLRIWFQNKRARWRRRVNDSRNNPYSYVAPSMSAFPAMIPPYGMMQPSPNMMQPSPNMMQPSPNMMQPSPNITQPPTIAYPPATVQTTPAMLHTTAAMMHITPTMMQPTSALGEQRLTSSPSQETTWSIKNQNIFRPYIDTNVENQGNFRLPDLDPSLTVQQPFPTNIPSYSTGMPFSSYPQMLTNQ